MKSLALILFLLIVIKSEAQTTKPIDGFLGIKFGSSPGEVVNAMKAKGFSEGPSNSTTVMFNDVALSGRKTFAFYVNFINDKAYKAQFQFKPEMESQSIDYYNSLVNDINGVYGMGQAFKNFKSPYKDGDGYEITAIKSGNADYYTVWKIGDNSLEANITVIKETVLVRLFYIDGKLSTTKDQQQKEKNKSEF